MDAGITVYFFCHSNDLFRASMDEMVFMSMFILNLHKEVCYSEGRSAMEKPGLLANKLQSC